MERFRPWLEASLYDDREFNDEIKVQVDLRYPDQPKLEIRDWGYIRLFYSGSSFEKPHWQIHMLKGRKAGAGPLLYFAALWWALTEGDSILKDHKEKPTNGLVVADTSITLDAARSLQRMTQRYGDYLYTMPHPNLDSVKINRADGSDWRRPAKPEEAPMWRLKKEPPFEFKFV